MEKHQFLPETKRSRLLLSSLRESLLDNGSRKNLSRSASLLHDYLKERTGSDNKADRILNELSHYAESLHRRGAASRSGLPGKSTSSNGNDDAMDIDDDEDDDSDLLRASKRRATGVPKVPDPINLLKELPDLSAILFKSGGMNLLFHLKQMGAVSKQLQSMQDSNAADTYLRPNCWIEKPVDVKDLFTYDLELQTLFSAMREFRTLDPILAYKLGTFAQPCYFPKPNHLPQTQHSLMRERRGFTQFLYASLTPVDLLRLLFDTTMAMYLKSFSSHREEDLHVYGPNDVPADGDFYILILKRLFPRRDELYIEPEALGIVRYLEGKQMLYQRLSDIKPTRQNAAEIDHMKRLADIEKGLINQVCIFVYNLVEETLLSHPSVSTDIAPLHALYTNARARVIAFHKKWYGYTTGDVSEQLRTVLENFKEPVDAGDPVPNLFVPKYVDFSIDLAIKYRELESAIAEAAADLSAKTPIYAESASAIQERWNACIRYSDGLLLNKWKFLTVYDTVPVERLRWASDHSRSTHQSLDVPNELKEAQSLHDKDDSWCALIRDLHGLITRAAAHWLVLGHPYLKRAKFNGASVPRALYFPDLGYYFYYDDDDDEAWDFAALLGNMYLTENVALAAELGAPMAPYKVAPDDAWNLVEGRISPDSMVVITLPTKFGIEGGRMRSVAESLRLFDTRKDDASGVARYLAHRLARVSNSIVNRDYAFDDLIQVHVYRELASYAPLGHDTWSHLRDELIYLNTPVTGPGFDKETVWRIHEIAHVLLHYQPPFYRPDLKVFTEKLRPAPRNPEALELSQEVKQAMTDMLIMASLIADVHMSTSLVYCIDWLFRGLGYDALVDFPPFLFPGAMKIVELFDGEMVFTGSQRPFQIAREMANARYTGVLTYRFLEQWDMLPPSVHFDITDRDSWLMRPLLWNSDQDLDLDEEETKKITGPGSAQAIDYIHRYSSN